ncbi:MAG: conjugal transfer protein TraX [Lachnospiraceae bacterium]|nr:conjugal transfer protein TraX [Lachnospiraceae bacterium]
MQKRGLSGAALKWIAVLCMAIDHTGATVALQHFYRMAAVGTYTQYYTAYTVYYVMRCIGRFSFPVYCFLLVEGFFHTRSRGKYLRNLAVFALVSEIPFDLAFYDTVFETSHQNVFLTLAIGLAALWLAELVWDRVKERTGRAGKTASPAERLSVTENASEAGKANMAGTSPLSASLLTRDFALRAVVGLAAVIPAAALAQILNTDYGGWGVAVIYIFYLLHDWKTLAAVAGVVALTIMQSIEIFGFPGIFCINAYNGTRGRQMKYFFYVFYPVHLLLLYGLCRALGYY